MSEEKMEQVFQISAPAHLEVKNIRGDVSITAGQGDVIHITAIKHVESGDAELTQVELTQGADGTVQAVARFPEGSFGWLSGKKACLVDFIIQAPPQCSTKINVVSCDASISDLEGEMECHTVSGDLKLHQLTGSFVIRTVSGDVEMNNVTGGMDIHTVSGDVAGEQISGAFQVDSVSGDVKLEKSTLPSLQAKSISGDFEMETPLGDGPYEFHTVSGDVELRTPAETKCSIKLHSLSGQISSKLPVTSSTRNHGNQEMDVQGGGVEVNLNSVSGSIKIMS